MMKSIVSMIAIFGSMSEADSSRRLLQAFPASPAQPAAPAPPSGGSMIPAEPVPPIIAIIPTPGPGQAAGPLAKIQCKDPCMTSVNCPSTCAMSTETVQNPANNFVMECSAAGACAASQFTFEWVAGGVTKFFNSIKVGAPYALYGSTITLDNKQAQSIKLITVECGTGNCAGATFVLNNAYIGDLKCDEYIGCGTGCMVSVDGAPAVTCDSVSTT